MSSLSTPFHQSAIPESEWPCERLLVNGQMLAVPLPRPVLFGVPLPPSPAPVPDRDGADFHLWSGQPVYLTEPHRLAISGYDLFHHLRGLHRYHGAPQVDVLLHSVFVGLLTLHHLTGMPGTPMPSLLDPHPLGALSRLTSDQLYMVRLGTSHDFAEMITGEITGRAKRLLPTYKTTLERPFEEHIRWTLGLRSPTAEEETVIKQIDRQAPRMELTVFKSPLAETWADERMRDPDFLNGCKLLRSLRNMTAEAHWWWIAMLFPQLHQPRLLRFERT